MDIRQHIRSILYNPNRQDWTGDAVDCSGGADSGWWRVAGSVEQEVGGEESTGYLTRLGESSRTPSFFVSTCRISPLPICFHSFSGATPSRRKGYSNSHLQSGWSRRIPPLATLTMTRCIVILPNTWRSVTFLLVRRFRKGKDSAWDRQHCLKQKPLSLLLMV